MSDWQPSIEALMALDDQAWLEVQQHYCGRLLAYIRRRLRDADLVEDVLQETLLGAVRGMPNFNPAYSVEQYLFGICHNRCIDALRKLNPNTVARGLGADDEGSQAGAILMTDRTSLEDSPSRVLDQKELQGGARVLLAEVLREWVQETWAANEFTRLMVVEALFAANWRNRDTWEHFDLRDETAVAGIKFRALKRMRQLMSEKDSQAEVLAELREFAEQRPESLEFGVADTWKRYSVSCPARYWLSRSLAGTLAEGPQSFVSFHLKEMDCPNCQANLEDLGELAQGQHNPDAVRSGSNDARGSQAQVAAKRRQVLERLERSTMMFLRSQTS